MSGRGERRGRTIPEITGKISDRRSGEPDSGDGGKTGDKDAGSG
jgi:hypothetical protein